jgi:hypothetical protein
MPLVQARSRRGPGAVQPHLRFRRTKSSWRVPACSAGHIPGFGWNHASNSGDFCPAVSNEKQARGIWTREFLPVFRSAVIVGIGAETADNLRVN